MKLYRKATLKEHQDFINYGTPDIIVRAVVPVEVNMGMIRRAMNGEAAADQAAADDDGSRYTWWHAVLTAALGDTDA